MALLLPHSVFLHVPKTGGTTVRFALDAAGIDTEELGETHENLCQLRERYADRIAGKFLFAFVRHPLSWYQSHWSFCMATGWSPYQHQPVDSVVMDYTFPGFIRKCIRHWPALVNMTYGNYVGRETQEIDFVGRQESLIDDLVMALTAAGEYFDEDALRCVGPLNRSASLSPWKQHCQYTQQLAEEVAEAEREAMDRFSYDVVGFPVSDATICL